MMGLSKKGILISLVAATIGLAACSEATEEAAEETVEPVPADAMGDDAMAEEAGDDAMAEESVEGAEEAMEEESGQSAGASGTDE